MLMHPVYFETRFHTPGPIHDWPVEFAIISAWPTTGSTWTDDKTRAADRTLEAELRGLEVWVTRITGYSPATGHAEPGWAVAVTFEQGCDTGLHFQQDAIYFVIGDELWVSHCDTRRGLVHVGRFQERIDRPR
ncbi:MAG: DUF3293 domain-containing protein [Chloroflexota bacterium]